MVEQLESIARLASSGSSTTIQPADAARIMQLFEENLGRVRSILEEVKLCMEACNPLLGAVNE